jgi:ferredoxin, 2Fe-2S
MPKVTYVLPDGSAREIVVEVGQSLMEAARDGSIDEIVAECGGALICASCHVRVPLGDQARLPDMSDSEDQMLDFVVAGRTPESRLSCQLTMTDEMDALVVEVAHPQL